MEQKEKIEYALRQIASLKVQAENILNGDKKVETIETFSQFSEEIKQYIAQNSDNSAAVSYLAGIPVIDCKRIKLTTWQALLRPSFLYHIAIKKTIDEISVTRNKYANLELILKGLDISNFS